MTTKTARDPPRGRWDSLPASLRAIINGLLITLFAANVWTPLIVGLGVPLGAPVEVGFLALFLWWASGGGPPLATQTARGAAFRKGALSPAGWARGLVAALSFAVTVHAAIVLLFRLVPFPTDAFQRGYDLSFIPSLPLKWLVVVISAGSAGICEETGFRGYMQQPIERRHGPALAILVSSIFFMLLHLTKGWATVGMIPIVLGAGVLLGLLAWSSESLIPGMIGHVTMDVGLFAYWWTGIAGDFTARPIAETGVDMPFLIACAAFATSLLVTLFMIWRLRQVTRSLAAQAPPPSVSTS